MVIALHKNATTAPATRAAIQQATGSDDALAEQSQMQDEAERRYVFVAIDRATRWVFIAIKSRRTAASARSFLNALAKAAPFRIRTILTDNGTEFTDRLFGSRAKSPSGEHEFDRLCAALDIKHRLTQAQDAADQQHGRAL